MALDSRSENDQPASVEIGKALRRLRLAGGATQVQIGDVVAREQGTISQWEKGRSVPSFAEMHKIEEHLRRKKGAILVAAGLVEVDGTEAAILADPDLEPDELDLLLDVYRRGVERSLQRRKVRK